MKRFAVSLVLLLAFFGLADSVYLAQAESSGAPVLCTIEGATDCNAVMESAYARVNGVPIAYLGVIFYALLFILAAVELAYPHLFARRGIQGLAAVGLISSAYLMFLQFSVIDAFCIYCTASAVAMLGIFVLAYFIEPLSPKEETVSAPPPRLPTRLVLPPLS